MGIAAISMRFPDRTTPIGTIINEYLQNVNELDDRAIHLLFSSNRWEAAKTIESTLKAGTSIVCDRYAYSGVAFSAAKVDANNDAILDLEWCKHPDRGLPAPDCVLFLDLTAEQAEARGGYVTSFAPTNHNITTLTHIPILDTVGNDTKLEICSCV